jgi:mannan endo-1,4-beta-mannosidase
MPRVVVTALLLCSLLHPLRAAAGPALLGVTYGNQGWDMTSVQALESWQGKRHAVVVMFTTWSTSAREQNNLFNKQLPAIWSNGNVPMVTWELNTGSNTPADIVRRVADGTYDGYIAGWASRMRTFVAGLDGVLYTSDDRRVYIRLGHEMNGDWYAWGQANPGEYIAMWQRVRVAFESQGLDASHVQWVWSVNHVDVGAFPAELYYPGDRWVDWIGIDGYNWGATTTWSQWQTPGQVFDPMLARVRAISSRPVALTETGTTATTTGGASIGAKATWIGQLFAWVDAANVKMVAWFNLDTDADFSVFGGRLGDVSVRVGRTTYRAHSAYKSAIAGSPLVSPSASDPRLISDALFAGE